MTCQVAGGRLKHEHSCVHSVEARALELMRIGDKVVNRTNIMRFVDRMLSLRKEGLSQLETAARLGVDRTLISRLEGIGEIRKGGVTGLIAFPVSNAGEMRRLARDLGVDFVFVMDNQQRWDYVDGKSGAALLNEIMQVITRARECDHVVVAASDMWLGMAEAILGAKISPVELGSSPMEEDSYLDPDLVTKLLNLESQKQIDGCE